MSKDGNYFHRMKIVKFLVLMYCAYAPIDVYCCMYITSKFVHYIYSLASEAIKFTIKYASRIRYGFARHLHYNSSHDFVSITIRNQSIRIYLR